MYVFYQFVKGFIGGVDVLKQFVVVVVLVGEIFGQQGYILIVSGLQLFDGDFCQIFVVVVDGEWGGEVWYLLVDFEFQFVEWQIDGKQWMSGGEIGFFMDVDQCQFMMVEQCLVDFGGLVISVGGYSGYF